MIFKWERGRQCSTDYYKMKLLSYKIKKIGIDFYILKYNPNVLLHKHKDIVKNGNHYRMNLNLIGKNDFWTEIPPIFKSRLINIFRPDINMHSLKVHTKTYKISVGYVKFNKSSL